MLCHRIFRDGEDKMRVSAYVKTDGACDIYRVVQPLTMLGEHTDAEVSLINLWDNEDVKAEKLDADIIIFPRVIDELMIPVFESLQGIGKKIIVEYDDDLFNVSPFSPHYKDHGIQNVITTLDDGTEIKCWTDGENIDLKRNFQKMESLIKVIGAADMVTVTTPILAEAYAPYSNNVVSLPNCVDMDLWHSLPLKEDDEIRLFWAGGSSHFEDLCVIQDVLPEIMKQYDNVKLVLMGMRFDGALRKIPEDRIEFYQWVPTPAYPYKTAIINPTIGLIPLVDNEFNRRKSPIKWLEWSALGIPCVSSNVSPYKEIATEDNGVFIENNNPRSWYEGISLLIEDKLLRAKIGGVAKRYVEDNFDAKKNASLWYDAYKSLIIEEEKVAS